MINLHLLIVDNEIAVRKAIAAALAQDSFFILRACALAQQALTTAVEWRPDLILFDDAMPDLDGDAAVARLRADRRTAPIPVVFLIERGQPRGRAHALGAAGVIEKPIDTATLGAQLRRFIAVEGVLSPAREDFLQRLKADACALSACRRHLTKRQPQSVLQRINQIAHSLAGAGGIYGFAGITCESAALSDAAAGHLGGRGNPVEVERALDRLLERIDQR